MYVIIVYDVEERRVGKVNKYLKRFLFWRQNSVFEGELSDSQFTRMITGIKEIVNKETDSILIYKLPSKKNIEEIHIGNVKTTTDLII